jgi:phosphoribosylamine--glycine ligase
LNILVVGNGGREHALTWKLAQSPKVDKIFVAPGNAGTARIARNINVKTSNIEELARFAQEHDVELVVVGPEGPLSEGIVDRFQTAGIPIFGPTKGATQIESSKAFAKELMQKYGIPAAQSKTFCDFNHAKEYIKQLEPPIVIKADGLAAGKGVVIANHMAIALDVLSNIMEVRMLGEAGDTVVIEEFMTGREMSFFAFTDGRTVVHMVEACDYKRVFDEDKGPNTGGMGSYSPPYFYTPELGQQVMDTIMRPSVRAMEKEKRPYKGVLYGGLMITDEGPKAMEFNARFGDPETQVILPRLKSDLVDIMLGVVNGTLNQVTVEISDEACVGVVLASAGYPGTYKTGYPISGLNDLDADILVFHAGTAIGEDKETVTAGGRVLAVVALGKDLAEAREKVYANISRISFEGCHYRKDIALIKQ